MILADTTIWIDHLRRGDPVMIERLNSGQIFTHPFVIGEIALGSLHRREAILKALRRLPAATRAQDEEVQILIEQQPLYNLGIGYVDAHLLAAVRLTPGLRLWTRDKRLHAVATELEIADLSSVH